MRLLESTSGVGIPRPRVSRASAQLKHSPELASCSGQLQKPQPGNVNPPNKADNTHGNMRGAAWRPCRSDTCRVQKARHSQCSQRPTAVDKTSLGLGMHSDKAPGSRLRGQLSAPWMHNWACTHPAPNTPQTAPISELSSVQGPAGQPPEQRPCRPEDWEHETLDIPMAKQTIVGQVALRAGSAKTMAWPSCASMQNWLFSVVASAFVMSSLNTSLDCNLHCPVEPLPQQHPSVPGKLHDQPKQLATLLLAPSLQAMQRPRHGHPGNPRRHQP